MNDTIEERQATWMPLPPFDMGGGLVLEVLPFDLDEERLLGVERLGLPLTERTQV